MASLVSIVVLVLQAAAQPLSAAPPQPDCRAPEHRQFDFWLGDWDVVPRNPPSPPRPPARNTITSAQDGCAILENWQAGTSTGQSINIYDRSRGEWHQTWVDNAGGLHEYWGHQEADRMVFRGSMPVPSNRSVRMQVRLTFFNLGPDQVRQLSERLNVDGTWSVNYDLLYTRRKP